MRPSVKMIKEAHAITISPIVQSLLLLSIGQLNLPPTPPGQEGMWWQALKQIDSLANEHMRDAHRYFVFQQRWKHIQRIRRMQDADLSYRPSGESSNTSDGDLDQQERSIPGQSA